MNASSSGFLMLARRMARVTRLMIANALVSRPTLNANMRIFRRHGENLARATPHFEKISLFQRPSLALSHQPDAL
jgi:hypothetical protein